MSLVIDSSVWINYFFEKDKKNKSAHYIQSQENVYIPTLVLSEVYKKIKKSVNESEALTAIIQLKKRILVPLDEEIALVAGDVAIEYKLAMADSIVYATALRFKAKLVTADNDFRGLPQTVIL